MSLLAAFDIPEDAEVEDGAADEAPAAIFDAAQALCRERKVRRAACTDALHTAWSTVLLRCSSKGTCAHLQITAP